MRWPRSCRPFVRALASWRQDTISKRLFLLLWVTLVLSHLMVVTFLLPNFGHIHEDRAARRQGPQPSAPG